MCRLLLPFAVLAAACDAPPTAAPPPDASPTSPDAANLPTPAPDAALLPTGAQCDDGACASGACVHGVCSPLCARDSDCEANQKCVGRGGAGRCSVLCRENDQCAAGLICVVNGPDEGFCVAPGPGPAGALCESREECESWFCSGGECLARCDDNPCPNTHRCLSLHTQSVCTPAGPLARESPCQSGSECVSGVCRGGRCSDTCPEDECDDDRVCVRWTTVNLCERRCARSADCGETGVCLLQGNQRVCATRGTTLADEACGRDTDCRSGLCADGVCARSCGDDRDNCPAGWACVEDIKGALCRPAGPAPLGARCAGNAGCATAVCGAGVCTRDCADGAACPAGTHCTHFTNGAFCFPDCRADRECPGVAFCDRNFAEGRTCFWRGTGDAGTPCTRHRECRSGHCANGFCLVTCEGGEPCPAGTRCVDADTADVCTQVPLSLGAACHTENACAEGLRCLAGRCVSSCEAGCRGGTTCVEGWCQTPCDRHEHCREGRNCDGLGTRVCMDPGPSAAGDACTTSDECSEGLCLDGACRALCGPCREGETCVTLGGRQYCLETGPKAVASACERHGECTSGLCIGQRCSGPCEDGQTCVDGMACEPVFGALRCVGACIPADGVCPPEGVCQVSRSESVGRCTARGEEGQVGDACETSADCGPGSIGCRSGIDGRLCRAACALWRGDGCADDEVCAATRVSDQTGACVPSGLGADLDPCGEDAECASGWCVGGYLEGHCGRRCQMDADCPDGVCIDIARNPAAPFWICAPGCNEDSDCETPLRCRRNMAGQAACY